MHYRLPISRKEMEWLLEVLETDVYFSINNKKDIKINERIIKRIKNYLKLISK